MTALSVTSSSRRAGSTASESRIARTLSTNPLSRRLLALMFTEIGTLCPRRAQAITCSQAARNMYCAKGWTSSVPSASGTNREGGMGPARQRLESDQLAVGQAHLRLIGDRERPLAQRLAELTLQREHFRSELVHHLVIAAEGAEPFFRRVHRNVGAAEKLARTVRVLWVDRGPNARR